MTTGSITPTRGHLRLLPGTASADATQEMRHEEYRRGLVLADLLAQHRAAGRTLCSLIGMTSDWASTRWASGAEPGVIAPVFRIVVHSRTASPAELHGLAERLAHHGWNGMIPASGATTRIEAAKGQLRMRLVSHDAVASLVLEGSGVSVGASLAKAVLAGVFEQEELSA